jgi:hypothetical protein
MQRKFQIRLRGSIHEILKSLADWAESLSPEEKAELRKALEAAAERWAADEQI